MTKTDNTEALDALEKILTTLKALGYPSDHQGETIRAALTSQAPEGWQFVPKGPTKDMYKNAFNVLSPCYADRANIVKSVYKAMLAAAPVYGNDGG